MLFKRKIIHELLEWKSSQNRKPLILNGARQVGKTFVMKWFGENHFKQYVYFNFDEEPALKQFFQSKEVKKIVENLSLVAGKKIDEETLIIFDEIQECHEALNTLKYFNEYLPSYHVVAAGSLLGVSLGKGHSFPVGKVQFLNFYPLTFFEFLEVASPSLYQYVSQLNLIEQVPDIFFYPLVDNLKQYFICGGLPAAALVLIETKDVNQVEDILKDLIRSYIYDFAKHPITKDVAKIGYIFNSIPSQLAKENKKFVFQLVKQGARAREYEDALQWLIAAGMVFKTSLCKNPGIPISAYDDLPAFKIYVFDVGILRNLAKLSPSVFINGNSLFAEFKGSLTENYILQSLMPLVEAAPRYWTSNYEAEVDFLIQYNDLIIPVEVKSSENVRSSSLAAYRKKYNPLISIRYSLKNLSFDYGLLNIPLFLVDLTHILIELALKTKYKS